MAARRHDAGARARSRRPPDPRDEDQLLGPAVRHRRLPRDRETSLIDMDEVERLAREHRPKVILAGWSAYPRHPGLRALPRDRRRGRRVPGRRHGAFRRAGGRRAASEPSALRRRGHHDDPQDDRRRPRGGLILCTEELRQEDRLGCVPGPAGRSARAHDRGQGRGAEDRRVRLSAERQERTLAGAKAVAEPLLGRAAGQRADRRHRCAPGPVRPARVRARRQAGRGPARTRSASPSTATRSLRPAAAGGLERAADRDAGAGHARAAARRTLPRSGGSSARRSRRGLRRRPGRAHRATMAIAERYPLYSTLGATATV